MAHYLKVADLLQLAPLRGARLVCGQAGAGNPVRGVNIIEAPDVADWIQPGDVLLTNFYAIDKLRPLTAFVEKLARKKLSALIVKTGLFVEAIPAELIEAASAHGLPIIEIARDVLYREVMLSVSEHLLNERIGILERFKEANDYFVGLSLANQDFYRILRSLETFIGNPVALYDHNFQCMFSTDGRIATFETTEPFSDAVSHVVRTAAFPAMEGARLTQHVFPMRVAEKTKLRLAAVEMNKPVEEEQLVAVRSAINLLALDFLKQFAIVEVEKHFRNDLLSDLLSGRAMSSDELLRRASLVQWDLRKTYVVATFTLATARNTPPPAADVERAFEHVESFFGPAPSQLKGDHGVLIWEVDPAKDWRAPLARRFGEAAENWARANRTSHLRVGVGAPARAIPEIATSYQQAQDALRIGAQTGAGAEPAFFERLGVYKLLCSVPSRQALRDMIPPALHALTDAPSRSRQDLLQTLAAYIHSNANALETSRRLDVHPKTVAYRLEKITELTGLNFSDADEMLMIHVGLKILKLLNEGRDEAPATR